MSIICPELVVVCDICDDVVTVDDPVEYSTHDGPLFGLDTAPAQDHGALSGWLIEDGGEVALCPKCKDKEEQ